MKRKSGITSTTTTTTASGGGLAAPTALDGGAPLVATVPPQASAAPSTTLPLPDAPVDVANATATVPPPPQAAPAKKRRVTQPVGNLTNAQKRMLCVKFAQVKMTQQELCVWAKDEFGLLNLPHQSTISKILARAGELTTMPSKDLSARRKGLVTHPELDTALCNWVLYARQNNMKLSGDMIKDKARQLAAQFGLSSTMTFSNGWLGGFKKRHNIRLGGATTATNTNSGGVSMAANSAAAGMLGTTAAPQMLAAVSEAAFASESASAAFGGSLNPAVVALAASASPSIPFAIRELQECAKLYHASDIFTMSETGLFFSLSPEKPPASSSSSSGSRKTTTSSSSMSTKKRLTIAFAANADGTERLEPFFIGSSKLPARLLQGGLDGEEPTVQFQYRDNKKAWMTPVLFQEWVGLLDTKLRDNQRNILLLIAHAPSHIRIGLELTNIRLEMLPPSTTSQYQPFEAGIFDAFKRRYRRHHLHHALDKFEAGLQDDIFEVELVQAMRWVRECWFSVGNGILKHYWDMTEVTSAPKPTPQACHAIEDAELTVENEICDAVSALPIVRPMTIEEFLSPGEENAALHCLGTDESDFIHSVGDNSEPLGFDTEKLANELRLLDSAVGVGGAGSSDAVMLSAASTVGHFGSRTSNERLLECFKVLLPELDRLRFDEHTKNSIRQAFRKLKEKESEHAADAKQRQAVRKAMMTGQMHHHLPFAAAAATTTAAVAAVETSVAMPPAPVAVQLPAPHKPDDAENTVV
ncbi:Ars binding protein 1 [Globisporangium polare]